MTLLNPISGVSVVVVVPSLMAATPPGDSLPGDELRRVGDLSASDWSRGEVSAAVDAVEKSSFSVGSAGGFADLPFLLRTLFMLRSTE